MMNRPLSVLCSSPFGRSLLAGLLTLALAGAAANARADDIVIGSLVPMTGDLQAYGQDILNGSTLAVEEINAAGGVLGRSLALAVGDTQTKPQAGVDTAQKLVALEGAVALVGALSSGVTIPIASSVSKPNRVVQISNASTSPVITTLDDDDFLFRTIPSDAFQGIALGQVVYESGLENVATLYINNDYGEGLALSFKSAFEALGGVNSAVLPYEPNNASYRGELAAAAREGAVALLLIGYPENGVIILRQALEEGYFSRFIFTDGMKSPKIIEAIGSYLDGSIGTNPQAMEGSQTTAHFMDAYEARFGYPVLVPFVDSAYDAVYLLALAMEAAGSADKVAIRDNLRAVSNPPGERVGPGDWAKAKALIAQGQDIDFVGAAGEQDFDATGDVEGTFAFWTIENGEFVTIKVFKPGG
jgi:branched-chain amino acid transport system substrate-binding protein